MTSAPTKKAIGDYFLYVGDTTDEFTYMSVYEWNGYGWNLRWIDDPKTILSLGQALDDNTIDWEKANENNSALYTLIDKLIVNEAFIKKLVTNEAFIKNLRSYSAEFVDNIDTGVFQVEHQGYNKYYKTFGSDDTLNTLYTALKSFNYPDFQLIECDDSSHLTVDSEDTSFIYLSYGINTGLTTSETYTNTYTAYSFERENSWGQIVYSYKTVVQTYVIEKKYVEISIYDSSKTLLKTYTFCINQRSIKSSKMTSSGSDSCSASTWTTLQKGSGTALSNATWYTDDSSISGTYVKIAEEGYTMKFLNLPDSSSADYLDSGTVYRSGNSLMIK